MDVVKAPSHLHPCSLHLMTGHEYFTPTDNSTCKVGVNLFIYLGFYVAFNTVQVISRRVVGRAEETMQYIEFTRVLYCKLPTNGKQLPAFPHKALMGIEPRPQRWEARVLPLCHHGLKLGSIHWCCKLLIVNCYICLQFYICRSFILFYLLLSLPCFLTQLFYSVWGILCPLSL